MMHTEIGFSTASYSCEISKTSFNLSGSIIAEEEEMMMMWVLLLLFLALEGARPACPN